MTRMRRRGLAVRVGMPHPAQQQRMQACQACQGTPTASSLGSGRKRRKVTLPAPLCGTAAAGSQAPPQQRHPQPPAQAQHAAQRLR